MTMKRWLRIIVALALAVIMDDLGVLLVLVPYSVPMPFGMSRDIGHALYYVSTTVLAICMMLYPD
jgi:hypothetical protein